MFKYFFTFFVLCVLACPSYATTAQVCKHNAGILKAIAALKDSGIDIKTQYELANMAEMPEEKRKFLQAEIPLLYSKENADKTPDAVFISYVRKCLNPPM